MRARWSCAIVLALLACRPARPDTVTRTDGLSINGSIVEMSNGVLTLDAWFSSGEQRMPIPIKYIQSIEFNSDTRNFGAPPKVLGIGPPAGQETPPKEPLSGDVIVFRGGARQPCILVRIDADRVHCGPKETPYGRITVLRIMVGSR
jgi:hypothetical protein